MCAVRRSSTKNQGLKSAAGILHELRWAQKILLVGGSELRLSLRTSIFRAHGLQVEKARTLSEASSLCKARTYDWVLLDVHQQFPGQVIHFCEQIKHQAPGQQIAFFVGPPTHISLKWPDEEIADREQLEHAAHLKAAA